MSSVLNKKLKKKSFYSYVRSVLYIKSLCVWTVFLSFRLRTFHLVYSEMNTIVVVVVVIVVVVIVVVLDVIITTIAFVVFPFVVYRIVISRPIKREMKSETVFGV